MSQEGALALPVKLELVIIVGKLQPARTAI